MRPDGSLRLAVVATITLSFDNGPPPGVTERVLAPTRADGINPYQWLATAVPTGGSVLDVACGSGPLRPLVGDDWSGIERSRDELLVARRALARRALAGTLLTGDATTLPFADESFDTVVCSMALQVIQPLHETLAEIGRVLHAGGRLVALVPSTRPLTLPDRLRWGRMLWSLRQTRLVSPNDSRLRDIGPVLHAGGLRLVADERRRFPYPLSSAEAAAELVASLYLPEVTARRRDSAGRAASRWVGQEIGIPLRRIVAIKDERPLRVSAR